jgi:protocatechuate 3,4-dioxygenase beta subunit
MVEFQTIYPSWYRGRTIHIHVMVHPTSTTAFTSQIYFAEDLNNAVLALAPYNTRPNRDTTNAADGIFRGAAPPLPEVTREGGAYVARLTLGIQGA